MTRRRRRRRGHEDVELNLAAMLDMAFQLLMFFILTFSPTPIESQVAMLLPDVRPVTKPVRPEVETDGTAARPLTVTVLSSPAGSLEEIAVEKTIVPDLARLNSQLTQELEQTGGRTSQLTLQVDGRLNYQQLMQIIEVCTQSAQGPRDGIQRVTFVELRDRNSR